MTDFGDIDEDGYLVIGLGRQVHFSQRITMVMNIMTPPEALNTRVVDSVLRIEDVL